MNLVSIIVPIFNGEKFLHETLQSVANQTYSNFEVLIINDGSTDNSLSVIEPYLTDIRFKVINKSNGGVSSARNLGLASAKGEYIALLDADDIWFRNNLQEKINILDSIQDVSFVYSDMQEIFPDDSSKIIKGYACKNITNQYLIQKDLPVPGICSNVVVRKSIIDKKKISFDESLSTAADQDFMIFLSLAGKEYYISKTLWQYRRLPDSMSRKISSIEADHLRMIQKYKDLRIFSDSKQKNLAFSNTHLILAGCFWKDAKNKCRSVYHVIFALWYNPKLLFTLLHKLL